MFSLIESCRIHTSFEFLLPRIRPPSLDALHSPFSAATLAWSADSRESSLTNYAVKQGVFHLLEQERKDEAETRMLDLRFMAAFSRAWETVVEPLKAWRAIGIQRMVDSMSLFSAGDLQSDATALRQICLFFRDAGLWNPVSLQLHAALVASEEAPKRLLAEGYLGTVLMELERYDEAESHLRDVVSRIPPGSTESSLTEIRNELSVCLGRSGKYEDALEIMFEVQSAFSVDPGLCSLEYLLSTNSIGFLLSQMGRTTDSHPYLESSFNGLLEHLGPTNPTTLSVWHCQGMVLQQQGKSSEAIELLTLGIRHATAALGLHSITTMGLYNRRGLVFLEIRDFEEAACDFEAAIRVADRTGRDWSSSTIMLRMNFGIAQFEKGDAQGALATLEDLWKTGQHALRPGSRDWFTLAQQLGALYKELERHQDAATLLDIAVDAASAVLPEDHPQIFWARDSLADIFMELEQWAKAQEHTQWCLKFQEACDDRDEATLAVYYWNHARILRELSRPAEAALQRRRCHTIEVSLYGETNEETMDTLATLADDLEHAGQPGEALKCYRACIELRSTALGRDHTSTMVAVNNAAWLILEQMNGVPGTEFARLLGHWTDPTNWKHHWARLGCSLCDVLESADFTSSEAVLADLIALLGEDHERITKGREKIAIVRQRVQDSPPHNEEA